MAKASSFIDGFLEDIRGQESAAIQDFIGSQNSSQEQIQAAFTALEESQKPTLVDQGGDIALALAAIVDMAKGGRSGRLASEKFREFRGTRRKERAGRKAEARDKLGTRLKLAEFSGDISGRNLTALLNTFGQERGDVLTSIKTALDEKKAKAALKESETRVKIGKKGLEGPSKDDIRNAAIEAGVKVDEKIFDQATALIGKFDPLGDETYAQWLDRFFATVDRISKRRSRIINPPKPGGKKADVGVNDLLRAHQANNNPFDSFEAEDEFRGDFVPEPEGAFDILKNLPQSLLDSFLGAFSKEKLFGGNRGETQR